MAAANRKGIALATFWGGAIVALLLLWGEFGGDGVFAFFLAVFFALIVVGIILHVVRVVGSMLGLGKKMCRRGWHSWDDFPIHHNIGSVTYLAVHGTRIKRCPDCGAWNPPDGDDVYHQYKTGVIQKVGGGIFTPPSVE